MEAFEKIIAQQQGAVYGFLLKLCGFDRVLAEDLTQETFLRAWLSFDRFRGECQVKTWLIQIARNCYLETLRRRRVVEVPAEEVLSEMQSQEAPPEEYMLRRELMTRSMEIIGTMHEKMRDVMIYRICGDLPYAQISALLGISESSGKVLYHRGKLLLRRKLKEDYGYEI